MVIKKLGLKNFRGLCETNINTESKYVVFLANNGEGKTSILESIYYCFTGSSFRTKDIKYLLQKNKENFEIKTEVDNNEKSFIIQAKYDDYGKSFYINDKQIKDRKDLIYNFPTVVLVSEDINFIVGSPENKRKFFDQVISLCDEEYLLLKKKYKSILVERNKLLKLEDKTLFNINDEILSNLIEQIQIKRKNTVNKLNDIIKDYYPIFFDKEDNIKIDYKRSIEADTSDIIYKVLKDNYDKDIEYGITRKGIHRDDFIIRKGMDNFINYASKGQLRLLALLYRLAEIKYINDNNGKEPFVLIDDVFLELDKTRRKYFFESLKGYSQLFLTFLPNEDYFKIESSNTKFYSIKDGNILAL